MNRSLPAPIVSRANRNLGGRVELTGIAQTVQVVKFPLAKRPDNHHYRKSNRRVGFFGSLGECGPYRL
jgi:hypothetical protein